MGLRLDRISTINFPLRLVNGLPMISGKAHILKSLEDELTITPKSSTISIETFQLFNRIVMVDET
jgi:hypothetical protein